LYTQTKTNHIDIIGRRIDKSMFSMVAQLICISLAISLSTVDYQIFLWFFSYSFIIHVLIYRKYSEDVNTGCQLLVWMIQLGLQMNQVCTFLKFYV